MGSVHLAVQESTGREVALKVIRPGFYSEQSLRRFGHETRVLARLQHAGIAQLFEAGTTQGPSGPQPFFAMELVDGAPITTYAIREGLDARARMALMIKVCEALQHAHHRGVIHRDLKPENILVDAGGQPKVLDFGVARATDDAQDAARVTTQVGQLVGTPAYMSPEQLAYDGELDTRSDVYALGVILYQLLSGRLPHEVKRLTPEVIHRIAVVEPPKLGILAPGLRGDAEHIVARAMAKDCALRYQSAAELGADLGRFLRHEPIAARRPSAVYVLRKFARRNKALVAGLLAAAVAIIAGTGATLWQWRRATVAAHDLAEQAHDLEMERNRALAAEGRAGRERDAAVQEAAKSTAVFDFIHDVLSAATPSTSRGRELTVREFLQRSATRVDQLAREPEIEAAIRETIGCCFLDLGQIAPAEAELRKAAAIARSHFGDSHRWTLLSETHLLRLLVRTGRNQEADELGRDLERRLKAAADAQFDSVVQVGCELAKALDGLGKVAESEAVLTETVAAARERLGDEHPRTLEAVFYLGCSRLYQGKVAEAVPLLEEVKVQYEKRFLPDDVAMLDLDQHLVQLRSEQGELEEARALAKDLLERQTRVLGPDQAERFNTLNSLGLIAAALGDYDDAEAKAAEAAAGVRRLYGDAHQNYLRAVLNQVEALYHLKRCAEAEPLARTALDRCKQKLGEQHEITIQAMRDLGLVLLARERREDAEALLERAASVAAASLPRNHWLIAECRTSYALLLVERQRFEEAEALLLESEAEVRDAVGVQSPKARHILRALVTLYERWGKPEEAEEYRALIEPSAPPAASDQGPPSGGAAPRSDSRR